MSNTPYGTTSFAYGGDQVESSSFWSAISGVNRYVRVTQPNGGKHLFLYKQDCSSFLSETNSPFPSTSPLSNTLDNVDQYNRNSFYFSPLVYSHLSSAYLSGEDPAYLTSDDYKLARLRHWLIDPFTTFSYGPGSSLSLERAPSPDGTTMGQMVWFDHDGKPAGQPNYAGTNDQPSFVARVLPDGSSNLRVTRAGPMAR
jgi:hypothetical protein